MPLISIRYLVSPSTSSEITTADIPARASIFWAMVVKDSPALERSMETLLPPMVTLVAVGALDSSSKVLMAPLELVNRSLLAPSLVAVLMAVAALIKPIL